MSFIPDALTSAEAEEFFVTEGAFKMVLFNNTSGTPFDNSTDYATLQPYIIPDNTDGLTWQDVTFTMTGTTNRGSATLFPRQIITFTRDGANVRTTVNGCALIRDPGTGYELISFQNGNDIQLLAGQQVNVTIGAGYGVQ